MCTPEFPISKHTYICLLLKKMSIELDNIERRDLINIDYDRIYEELGEAKLFKDHYLMEKARNFICTLCRSDNNILRDSGDIYTFINIIMYGVKLYHDEEFFDAFIHSVKNFVALIRGYIYTFKTEISKAYAEALAKEDIKNNIRKLKDLYDIFGKCKELFTYINQCITCYNLGHYARFTQLIYPLEMIANNAPCINFALEEASPSDYNFICYIHAYEFNTERTIMELIAEEYKFYDDLGAYAKYVYEDDERYNYSSDDEDFDVCAYYNHEF